MHRLRRTAFSERAASRRCCDLLELCRAQGWIIHGCSLKELVRMAGGYANNQGIIRSANRGPRNVLDPFLRFRWEVCAIGAKEFAPGQTARAVLISYGSSPLTCESLHEAETSTLGRASSFMLMGLLKEKNGGNR